MRILYQFLLFQLSSACIDILYTIDPNQTHSLSRAVKVGSDVGNRDDIRSTVAIDRNGRYLARTVSTVSELISTLDNVHGNYDRLLNVVTVEVSRRKDESRPLVVLLFSENEVNQTTMDLWKAVQRGPLHIFRVASTRRSSDLFTNDGKSFNELLKCRKNDKQEIEVFSKDIRRRPENEGLVPQRRINVTPRTTQRPTTNGEKLHPVFRGRHSQDRQDRGITRVISQTKSSPPVTKLPFPVTSSTKRPTGSAPKLHPIFRASNHYGFTGGIFSNLITSTRRPTPLPQPLPSAISRQRSEREPNDIKSKPLKSTTTTNGPKLHPIFRASDRHGVISTETDQSVPNRNNRPSVAGSSAKRQNALGEDVNKSKTQRVPQRSTAPAVRTFPRTTTTTTPRPTTGSGSVQHPVFRANNRLGQVLPSGKQQSTTPRRRTSQFRTTPSPTTHTTRAPRVETRPTPRGTGQHPVFKASNHLGQSFSSPNQQTQPQLESISQHTPNIAPTFRSTRPPTTATRRPTAQSVQHPVFRANNRLGQNLPVANQHRTTPRNSTKSLASTLPPHQRVIFSSETEPKRYNKKSKSNKSFDRKFGSVPRERLLPPTSTTTQTTTTTRRVPPACMIDILFLVDFSRGTGDKSKSYFDIAASTVGRLPIADNAVRVGMLGYSGPGRTTTLFNLDKHSNKDDVIEEMFRMESTGGTTRTGEAIQYATKQFRDQVHGARKRAKKVLVVFTDGFSQDDPKPAADAARRDGIVVVAVAVDARPEPNIDELLSIAGHKNLVLLSPRGQEMKDKIANNCHI